MSDNLDFDVLTTLEFNKIYKSREYDGTDYMLWYLKFVLNQAYFIGA